MSIIEAWNESAARRMQKGGDLYRRPLTRADHAHHVWKPTTGAKTP